MLYELNKHNAAERNSLQFENTVTWGKSKNILRKERNTKRCFFLKQFNSRIHVGINEDNSMT